MSRMEREAPTTISGVSLSLARRAWTMFEPIHAIVYFAPEAIDLYKAAGLRGGWMGYFASRSAPMGAVSAPVVIATFHSFRPSMVERAIPDAWEYSSPERALAARLAVADTVLRRLWGDAVDSPEVAEAAAAAMEVARTLRGDGRPIYRGARGAARSRTRRTSRSGTRARSSASIASTDMSRRSPSTASTGSSRW